MSTTAKSLDPAFQGAGQRVGAEIWRIENFQLVPLPKTEHGKFYMGDCYIILLTTPGKGGTYLFDIHFWIGKDTSQDEAGTAAIKTVSLMLFLEDVQFSTGNFKAMNLTNFYPILSLVLYHLRVELHLDLKKLRKKSLKHGYMYAKENELSE